MNELESHYYRGILITISQEENGKWLAVWIVDDNNPQECEMSSRKAALEWAKIKIDVFFNEH